jgi:predicted ATPase
MTLCTVLMRWLNYFLSNQIVLGEFKLLLLKKSFVAMNINKISVKIFKNKIEFELAPITLLTGPNNSGKSSFTKFLDLLSSNYKNQNLVL